MDKADGNNRQYEFICTRCRKHFWEECVNGEYWEYSLEDERDVIRKADGTFVRLVVCPNCATRTVVVRPQPIRNQFKRGRKMC